MRWPGCQNPLNSLNAYIQCREHGYRHNYYGGGQLSRNFVKISARTVLELLAGRKTISEINQVHGWCANAAQRGEMLNPFERRLREGRMVTRIGVEAAEDEPDDGLTIEFGEPDPAISPFLVKRNSES
jgi:hypothetical protein